MDEEIVFQYIQTNGIKLHVALSGPKDGELAVLLHGFPDFWFGWRKQIKALADAGYRVVVPDQRGYNKSQKPDGIRFYALDHLKNDVAGLIQYFERKHAVIIGHDWGGTVGWHLADKHPHMVSHLIVINIPHTAVFPKVMITKPSQLLKSSYVLFFQLPKIPEKILGSRNFQNLAQGLNYISPKSTFTKDELVEYKNAWAEPKALTKMLNWYRALPISISSIETSDKIKVPVKIIWGTKDQFLSERLAEESLNFIERGSITWIEKARHWVQLEQPDFVNDQILQFLNATGYQYVEEEKSHRNRVLSFWPIVLIPIIGLSVAIKWSEK